MATTAVRTPVASTRLKAYTGTPNTIGNDVAPGNVITVSHSSAAVLNMPDEDVIDFPLGTVLYVVQIGAGAVTFTVPGSDSAVGTVATVAAGDTLVVTKTAAGTWHSALAT